MLQNNQDSIVLSKSSSHEDLKRYFTAVLELSKSDNKFPINLDEVWPLVYNRRDKAVSTLKKNFFEGEDFQIVENQPLPQMVERTEKGFSMDGIRLTTSSPFPASNTSLPERFAPSLRSIARCSTR